MTFIMLADANSRVGSHPSPAIGDYGAEEETTAGAIYHDFLLAHNLCLPSTFSDIHFADSWTWWSATGERHRLDYVAVPQAWLQFNLDSKVWYDFEVMQQKCDHVPVVPRCRFQRQDAGEDTVTFRRRACRPNDLDVHLDRAAFQHVLSTHQLPLWDVDVDTHFARFTNTWVQAGKTVMAVGKKWSCKYPADGS